MLKKIVAIADTFIPSTVKSRDDLFKARLILYPNFFAAIVVLTILFIMSFSGTLTTSQGVSYVALAVLHTSFLFILKKSTSIEWTGIAFLCALSTKSAVEAVLVTRSPINSGLYNFILYIVFGFLITSSWKKRAVLSLWLATFTGLAYWFLKDLGYQQPYGYDQDLVLKNAAIALGLRSFLALVSVYWFVHIRNISDYDLEQEIDWQIRSEKLNEISNMIKTMFPKLDQPLANILETLKAYPSTPEKPSALSELDRNVRQLKEIAQSISWVYRAYRNESVEKVSSYHILEQLNILLDRSYGDSGWTIVVRSPDKEIDLEGPMPSLVLLLLSLVEEIVASAPQKADRSLDIEFKTVNGEQIWTLSWPSNQVPSKAGTKKDLIEDLGLNIKATISWLSLPFKNLIEIRGQWQAPLSGDA